MWSAGLNACFLLDTASICSISAALMGSPSTGWMPSKAESSGKSCMAPTQSRPDML